MKMCQLLARETLKNHEIHYHGAIDEPQIEFLDNYKGRKGTFLKKFLIDDTMNLNTWGVTWEAIKKDVWDFIGKPLVLTPKRNHPRVYEQEDYRIGEIIDLGLMELEHKVWQVSHILDKKAAELIRKQKVKYGSPTVLVYSPGTVEIRNENTAAQETILHRFIPAHDCIVGEPAYGKLVDYIPAICDGDGPACALKLLEVSASIGDDNTDQLTIVPFVKSTLKKHFKAETFAEIVGYIQNTHESNLDSCVERKIKILADEHPKWDNDQVVAVAFSYCREKKGDIFLDIIKPEILQLREKIQNKIKLDNEIAQLGNKLKIIKT